MKKMKTCEEYVLKELAVYKTIVHNLMDDRNALADDLEDVRDVLDVLRNALTIHETSDGKGVITMSYIFEEFNPEEFRLLKEMFDLTPEGKDE